MNEATATRPIVVGIGESLFDCFPDREVLGGAPLNVALHADALLRPVGGAGVPATRVGRDPLGERLLRELTERGLDTHCVQIDEHLPTGRVDVSLDAAGNAGYRFEAPSAWDALGYSPTLAALAERCDAVAFGTLGQRAALSRESIAAFLADAPQAIRLFDANLRQDSDTAEALDRSLRLASAAKFNEQEIEAVRSLLDLAPVGDLDKTARGLLDAYDLGWVAITRGARGTLLLTPDARHEGEPVTPPHSPGADSVGAGDACSAGLLCGAVWDWPPQRTLALANRLGAHVASQPGATPRLPAGLLTGLPAE